MLNGLKNKVSLLLILTVLLGVISTNIPFPEGRITHISGRVGHTMPYFFYFCFQYVIGFIFVAALLIKERTEIDNWMIKVYLFFDVLSFGWYIYNGWPEPKMFMVFSFFVSLITYIVLRIFK